LRRTWAMMTGLQRSSRMIVPAVRKGVPIGFVLYAISGLPLLKEMGFTNGDLVRRVAGHTVSGPEEVEDVVRRLDKARAFSVDFCRAGRHQHLVVVLAQE